MSLQLWRLFMVMWSNHFTMPMSFLGKITWTVKRKTSANKHTPSLDMVASRFLGIYVEVIL